MLAVGRRQPGTKAKRDCDPALFLGVFWAAQPKLWTEMRGLHVIGWKADYRRAYKGADLNGALHVLRHGFKVFGKNLRAVSLFDGAMITIDDGS